MRYAWVSLSILAIWISTIFLMVSGRLESTAETFFLFIMITTIALSFIGFRSA